MRIEMVDQKWFEFYKERWWTLSCFQMESNLQEDTMEYIDYPEYADIMELFIETLTGTVFELRVSPFETVISVKAKIQRLEGAKLLTEISGKYIDF